MLKYHLPCDVTVQKGVKASSRHRTGWQGLSRAPGRMSGMREAERWTEVSRYEVRAADCFGDMWTAEC